MKAFPYSSNAHLHVVSGLLTPYVWHRGSGPTGRVLFAYLTGVSKVSLEAFLENAPYRQPLEVNNIIHLLSLYIYRHMLECKTLT